MFYFVISKAIDGYMEIIKVGDSSRDMEDNQASCFKCNICLELADQDPILTPCGHLYCWPCLYRRLCARSSLLNKPRCPVCRAVVKKNKLIPISGITKLLLDSGKRTPSVPPGFEIPNRSSPSSSSSNSSSS
ncbi:hypothetical protein ACFX11_003174 [Malus domestica]